MAANHSRRPPSLAVHNSYRDFDSSEIGNSSVESATTYTVHIPPTPDNHRLTKDQMDHHLSLDSSTSSSPASFHPIGRIMTVSRPNRSGSEPGLCQIRGCDARAMSDGGGAAVFPCRCEYRICGECFKDAAEEEGGGCPGCKLPYEKGRMGQLDRTLTVVDNNGRVHSEFDSSEDGVIDQLPKLRPAKRLVDLELLTEKFETPYAAVGKSDLPGIDVIVSTSSDPDKDPTLVTANTVLSVLAADYPNKVRADFVRDRRRVKREYDEFKVCINGLPDSIRRRSDAYNTHEEIKAVKKIKERGDDDEAMERVKVPRATWMADGTHWAGTWNPGSTGHNRADHSSIIQVMLQPPNDESFKLEPNEDDSPDPTEHEPRLPTLVYVSREKRSGYDHNKKAGEMNAIVRVSAIMSNGPFVLSLDCDHYIHNSKALREGICFMLDGAGGQDICYVQYPHRYEGVDPSDRYANRNSVFFDVNMRALDGIQGPVYVGTGCLFRRTAVYGFDPPEKKNKKLTAANSASAPVFDSGSDQLSRSSTGMDSIDDDVAMNVALIPKKFGNSSLFVDSIRVTAYQGLPLADHPSVINGRVQGALTGPREPLTSSMIGEAVNVISSWYEDKTEWGGKVGWTYGSTTEDVVTGYRMHERGWRSVYCVTKPDAFRGIATINLTDRLHEVLRSATGSVEILFSRNNALLASHKLKFLQRVAYLNVGIRPFSSIFLLVYCFLPALSLFTDKLIVPSLDIDFLVYLLIVTVTLAILAVLEIKWSGVALEEWWRDEQFWVIGGTSAHLAAVVQGMLKSIVGVDMSLNRTIPKPKKGRGNDNDQADEFAEMYLIKWTSLMIPPCTIIIVNIVGIAIGFSRTISSDTSRWENFTGGALFSLWVLVHLYPFAKECNQVYRAWMVLAGEALLWFNEWQIGKDSLRWIEFCVAVLNRFPRSFSSSASASAMLPSTIQAVAEPVTEMTQAESGDFVFSFSESNCSLVWNQGFNRNCTGRELIAQVLYSSSNLLLFQMAFNCVIDIWGRQVKKWKYYCDYGLETCLISCCGEDGFSGSNHCVLYQDHCKALRSAHQVFDESSMSELCIWKFILASPSQDHGLIIAVSGRGVKKWNFRHGLVIDVWGRGVKKWKLIATYVELHEDHSLLVVIGANNRLDKVLGNDSTFTWTTGKHLRVGDIVEVDKDEHFPTDLFLLSLSYGDGACYVQTKNLDGETNLKYKHAILMDEVKRITTGFFVQPKVSTALQLLGKENKHMKKKSVQESTKRKRLPLYDEVIELKGNIRVFCRCNEKGSNSVVEFDSSQDNELQILYSNSSTLQFKLDHVFKTEDNQEVVFARTKPIITSVLDGYDVCIFAYGKNRTGKTFKMEGTLENRGVNYRSRKELFRISEERKVYMKYELYISMLEGYNGKLRDLLVQNSKLHSKQLDIKQVPRGKGRTSLNGTVIEEIELRKRCISLNVQSYSSLLCVYWVVLLFVHPNVSTNHIMQLLRLVEFEWCYGFKGDGAVKYKHKLQYSNSRVVKKVNEKHITSVFTFKEDSIENKAFCQLISSSSSCELGSYFLLVYRLGDKPNFRSGEEEDFDEWDEEFVNELIQKEEIALTASSSSSSSKLKPSLLLQPPPRQPLIRPGDDGYSPPRELTQRPLVLAKSDCNGPSSFPQNDIEKEDEIRRLKRELELRSKQLAQMEHECSELKKERVKRDEQVKSTSSRCGFSSSKARNLDGKGSDVDAQHDYLKTKSNELLGDGRKERCRFYGFVYVFLAISFFCFSMLCLTVFLYLLVASSSRAVGIQTDKDDDPVRGDANHGASSSVGRCEELRFIWGSTSHQQSGRNFISKLLMACTEDLRVLFGTMNLSMHPVGARSSTAAETAPSASFSNHVHGLCPADAAKVSELYNVMIKISNGLLKVEALFGPLFDLCDVKSHLLILGSKSRRENVKVEGLHCDISSKESYGGVSDSSNLSAVSCVNWHSLFELMLQIALDNSNERVRSEAISIMNLIVSTSNAFMEREKYGPRMVLQSIAQFLKRDAGLSVQKAAVHLLFLLLNCPKILSTFCSGCHEERVLAAKGERNISSTCIVYSVVLSGLAECISCSRNSSQHIELCKRAIATLAFLAASEKSGYEILVSHRVSGGANFLMLILQELASEMDLEGSDSVESVEKVQARTMLIREALILLNRLVSSPGSSAVVLRVLTGSRDMASLTIDVASRLSSKERTPNYYSSTAGESEALDLAKKFKRRVYAYLGSVVA
ncbi:Cellulose synthase-like protein D2 [Linum grandiflorum]